MRISVAPPSLMCLLTCWLIARTTWRAVLGEPTPLAAKLRGGAPPGIVGVNTTEVGGTCVR